MLKNYAGVWTALMTPFLKEGDSLTPKIDWNSLERILQMQMRAKVAGVVLGGTTGESPTLKFQEKVELYRFCRERLKGGALKIMMGVGTNDTHESLELTEWASNEEDVHSLLVVAPYYNKPTLSGQIQHFQAVAEKSKKPLMLYNVPGRTGYSLDLHAVKVLFQHPRIHGIKEASGNLVYLEEILTLAREASNERVVLSGDDPTYYPALCLGAVGTISVASHLIPEPWVKMTDYVAQGKYSEARDLHQFWFPLVRDLFLESNPIPLKAAMSALGYCEDQLRLPLTPMSASSREKLLKTLENSSLV
jgi:4-hydroxy-tetrahydrodipicolinate synthase